MRISIFLAVLGMLQFLGVVVSSDLHPTVSYQQLSSCQEESVEVITERVVLRRAWDLITVTLTSTSTDTTDCTCTETSITTPVTGDTSSTLTFSSPSASSTTETPIRTNTTISLTTKATSSLETVISVTPTVITIDKPTTMIDWRTTTVTSIITVTDLHLSSSAPSAVLPGTTLTASPTETLTTQKSSSTRASNHDNSRRETSILVVSLTTIIIDDPSTATEWSIVTATDTTTESIWASSSHASLVTVTETLIQPFASTTYDAASGISPLPESSIRSSTNAEAVLSKQTDVKPGSTAIAINDAGTVTELEIKTIMSTNIVNLLTSKALRASSEATATELFQGTTARNSQAQLPTQSMEETHISITVTSTETPVTPLDKTFAWWDVSGSMADTIPVANPPLLPTSASSELSLSICPSRTTNPTFTPLSPLPKDYTWGCPPHFLCNPSKKTVDGECNFESGPPADTYYCRPEECIRSPKLGPPQFWGPPITSEKIEKYNATRGYINLSPIEFGLGYDIFNLNESAWDWKRNRAVNIPGKCYDECNDAMLEAESSGKTPDLCYPDSAFLTLVHACRACVNSVSVSRSSTGALPEFQQFLFYCEEAANPTSAACSSPATRDSSRGCLLTTSNKASPSIKVAPTTPSGPIASSQHDVREKASVSTARTKSASAKLPLSTTTGLVYTADASLLCPPLFFWVTMSLNVFFV